MFLYYTVARKSSVTVGVNHPKFILLCRSINGYRVSTCLKCDHISFHAENLNVTKG